MGRFLALALAPILLVVAAGFAYQQIGGPRWSYFVVLVPLGLLLVFYINRQPG